nr:nitrate reductase [Actinomycetota bacterium]NIT98835.1 nitrate reductase [Actinomycetota bacterium]NIV90615.1 nitrate reductase [Actinomycetota bacterium]NIW33096.1 nitrate reductase [Actinomycetota bacterium]NIX25241.1 nitrate reductase [Actinomycetota bacterium]
MEDSVLTTCWIGSQACGIRAQRVDGRIVKLDGDLMNPLNRGALCPRGQAQIASVYDPDRLRTPLVRTNPKGERGAWRE